MAYGQVIDNYLWHLFHSKLCLFLLLCQVSWSFNSLLCIWLIWLRTRIEEFNARAALTALMVAILLTGSNLSLMQLLLPFEVVRWLLVSQASWTSILVQQLQAWLPTVSYDICLFLSHMADTRLVVSDYGCLLLLPGSRILCYNSSSYSLTITADSPVIHSSMTANYFGFGLGRSKSCCDHHCSNDSEDHNPHYSVCTDINHTLCSSCYYRLLISYGRHGNIPCPVCTANNSSNN